MRPRDSSNEPNEEAVELLARYWDDIALRSPLEPVPPRDLDPSLATSVRRFHAADDAPGADQKFAARLLEDLMSVPMTS